MVVAVLLAALGVLVLAGCLQHARAEGWTAPGLPNLRPRCSLPPTPADDLPPPNLTPLIPSPRLVAREFERGLRELTLYLAARPEQ